MMVCSDRKVVVLRSGKICVVCRMIKHACGSDDAEHSNMIELSFSQDAASSRDGV